MRNASRVGSTHPTRANGQPPSQRAANSPLRACHLPQAMRFVNTPSTGGARATSETCYAPSAIDPRSRRAPAVDHRAGAPLTPQCARALTTFDALLSTLAGRRAARYDRERANAGRVDVEASSVSYAPRRNLGEVNWKEAARG